MGKVTNEFQGLKNPTTVIPATKGSLPATTQTVAEAVINVTERKANPFAPTGKGGKGGVALNMSVSLTDNATADYVVAPRQVQLVLAYIQDYELGDTVEEAYIHSLGGTATVQQLNDVAVKATGDMTWCRPSGVLYEQTPQKIMRTYITKMKGELEWSKSKGLKSLVS